MNHTGVWSGRSPRRARRRGASGDATFSSRSEEHTSELQSLMRNSYAGFCMKKKKLYKRKIKVITSQHGHTSVNIKAVNDTQELNKHKTITTQQVTTIKTKRAEEQNTR